MRPTVTGASPRSIAIRNGAHRWMHAAKLLTELRAESIRLYDEDGRIIGSTELLDVPASAPADVVDAAPVASSVDGAVLRRASDVGIITHAVADAIVRAVRESSKAQADVHKVAFEQLAKVAELATERVQSLEGLVQTLIEARAAELAKREAEAEAVDDGTGEIMKPLLQGAGAELVQKLPQLLQLAQSMSPPPAPNGAAANGAGHGPPK